MHAEAACQTYTDCGMLNYHAPFLVAHIAPTIALDPLNASAVVLDLVNSLAEVPDRAGVKIASQVSANGEAWWVEKLMKDQHS